MTSCKGQKTKDLQKHAQWRKCFVTIATTTTCTSTLSPLSIYRQYFMERVQLLMACFLAQNKSVQIAVIVTE